MSIDRPDVPDWLDVSRETQDKLRQFLALVAKWNPTINLVSAGSITDGWTRHIIDSAQLWNAAPLQSGLWLDVGSGGGFPGLVIAIIARERAPNLKILLVEADRRKCVFLSEAARQLNLVAEVTADRIEMLEAKSASVISARAVGSLDNLLQSAVRHLAPNGVALFPKGQNFEQELASARQHWRFDCKAMPSLTDPKSAVLRIENIQHV